MLPGFACLVVDGPKAAELFKDEAGGHRWQRVPPTEKRGRVQTSTITVAVLNEEQATGLVLHDQDLRIDTTRGSGAGGQHRNKTDSCVRITHLPTGTVVRCETERSQHQNRRSAMTLLRSRLSEAASRQAQQGRQDHRRQQVGSGMRGDKRRTIRVRDDQVTDHITGASWRYRDYLKGRW